MKKIIFLLFIILIFSCSDEENIVGPDYSKVSIIAGKVKNSGIPSTDFRISINLNNGQSYFERFKSPTGNYTVYINVEGTVSVMAYIINGTFKYENKDNIKLKLGEITELNFDL